jgi:hypothetical protein
MPIFQLASDVRRVGKLTPIFALRNKARLSREPRNRPGAQIVSASRASAIGAQQRGG